MKSDYRLLEEIIFHNLFPLPFTFTLCSGFEIGVMSTSLSTPCLAIVILIGVSCLPYIAAFIALLELTRSPSIATIYPY